jgi:hypothetical protein
MGKSFRRSTMKKFTVRKLETVKTTAAAACPAAEVSPA